MAVVLGQDVVLQFTDDGFPFACARSISLTIDNDMIETSTTGSGNFRTYTPGPLSYNGTIEGLTFINNSATIDLTISTLYSYITTGQLFKMVWYEEDDNHQYYMRKYGFVYLESLTETASFDNVVTFSANFRGSGTINIENGTL